MFDYTSLMKCRDSLDWMCQSSCGIELIVAGTQDGVDEGSLRRAKTIVANIDREQAKAVRLLESFMKDKGAWHLDGIDLGSEAARQGCDFQLELSFIGDDDPYEYIYTYFSVCFAQQDASPPPHNTPHPFKFIIQFR